MGWFSMLLGTGGVVDGIKEGVDKAILTDEERLDYHTTMLKAYEPFKLIQRGLAIAVTIMFAFVMIIQVVLVIISIWFVDVLAAVEVMNELEVVSTIGYSFLAIMSLYFTGGVVNSFKSK